MICGNAVRAQQHEVFQFGVGKLHAAENSIVESRAAGLGHGEAYGGGFSRGATLGALLARNLSTGSFVARWTPLGCGGRAALLQFGLRAKTIVGISSGQEFRSALAIQFHALRLMVGSLIPVEAKPAHALQDALNHFRCRALEVGVFNAQDERATVMAGEEPVE